MKMFACECGIHKLSYLQKVEYENSECIFIGEVTDVNKSENTFIVKVVESLDGGDEIGNIYFGKNWSTCSPYIREKGKWIIYGSSENGFLRLNMCGISRDFENPDNNFSLIDIPLNESQLSSKLEIKKAKKKAKDLLRLEIIALRKKRDEKKASS